MVVTRKNIKVGMEIYWAIDERPYDEPIIHRAIITDVYDTHYLFTTYFEDGREMCPHVWGDYDFEDGFDLKNHDITCVCFLNKKDAEKWLEK